MIKDKESIFETLLKQANKTFERWYQGDPFGFLDNMAEEINYFSPFLNRRVDGKSALEAIIAPIEGQINVPKFEIGNPNLQLGESIAVFTFHLSELDADGVLLTGWKVTEVYRHVRDEWIMIHTHYSPFVENQ